VVRAPGTLEADELRDLEPEDALVQGVFSAKLRS
jgi:hypothetical protein